MVLIKAVMLVIILMVFQSLCACHLRIRNFTTESVRVVLFNDETGNVFADSDGSASEHRLNCYRIPGMAESRIMCLLRQGFSVHHAYVLLDRYQRCSEPLNLEKALWCYPVDYGRRKKCKDSEVLEINIFPSRPQNYHQVCLPAVSSYDITRSLEFSVACYLYDEKHADSLPWLIKPAMADPRVCEQARSVHADCYNAVNQCAICERCFGARDAVAGYQSRFVSAGIFKVPYLAAMPMPGFIEEGLSTIDAFLAKADIRAMFPVPGFLDCEMTSESCPDRRTIPAVSDASSASIATALDCRAGGSLSDVSVESLSVDIGIACSRPRRNKNPPKSFVPQPIARPQAGHLP